MTFKSSLMAALAAASFAFPAFGEPVIAISDAYARAAGMHAIAGAAFMEIVNTGDEDDRLIGARSDIAKRVELHTHIANAEGVMQMVEVPEGWAIPAGGGHMLRRGGDHVMFMGLNAPMIQGESVAVTLIFEKSGEVNVEIPVDLTR